MNNNYSLLKKICLILGPAIAIVFSFFVNIEGLAPIGCKAIGLTLWMVIWWVSDCMPLWITSLLPVAGSIILGIAGKSAGTHTLLDGTEVKIEVYSNYAASVVLMCIGVFVIAAVIERWNLHKRIALSIVSLAGDRPFLIIMAFGIATGFISMFISNTTAAAMMLPIALAMVKQFEMKMDNPFAKALVINTVFAAASGGMGTMIGSGTNISAVGLIYEMTGLEFTFVEWMKIGFPLVVFIVPLGAVVCYFVCGVKGTSLGDASFIKKELKSLGKMNRGEVTSLIYLVVAILAFFFRAQIAEAVPFLSMLSDDGLGILLGVIAFVIPINFKEGVFLMDSKYAMSKISWSTYLLLGGALQLGSIFKAAGVSAWIGEKLVFLEGMPTIVVILIIAVIASVISEVVSNFVVVAAFMPVMYSLSLTLGLNPLILMMTVTLAASFSYALPSSTPPIALAFSTGYVEMKDMIKTGFALKFVACILFPVIMYLISMPLSPLF